MMMVEMRVVYTIDVSGNIKQMWVGGGWHCRQQGTQGLDQGARGHKDHFGWNFFQLGCDLLW